MSSNSRSASEAIPQILRNPNVHYPTDNSRSLFSILGQLSPIHNFPSCLSNIVIIIIIIIIMPSKPKSSKQCVTFLFPYQILYLSLFSPFIYTRPTCIIVILLIAQPNLFMSAYHGALHCAIFRKSSCYLRLRAQYLPQHPIFENCKPMFFP